MTSDEVKNLIEQDSELTAADRVKMVKNLLTVRLATTAGWTSPWHHGEQSVRRFRLTPRMPCRCSAGKGGRNREAQDGSSAPKKKTKP